MIFDDSLTEVFVDEVEDLRKKYGYSVSEAAEVLRLMVDCRAATVLESSTVVINGKRFLRTTPTGRA